MVSRLNILNIGIALLIVLSSKCKVWFSTSKRKRIDAPSSSDGTPTKRIKSTAEEPFCKPTLTTEGIEEHIDEESDSEIEVFRNIRVKQNAIYRGQLLEEYIKDYRRLPRKRQMMFRKRMERALFERGYLSEKINRALKQEPFSPNIPPFSGSFSRSRLEEHLSRYPTECKGNEDVSVPYLIGDDPIKVHRQYAPPDILDSYNIGWEEDPVSSKHRTSARFQLPLVR